MTRPDPHHPRNDRPGDHALAALYIEAHNDALPAATPSDLDAVRLWSLDDHAHVNAATVRALLANPTG